MYLPASLVPERWQWLASVALFAVLVLAVARAPWSRLREDEQSHLWLGMIVFLALLWSVASGFGQTVRFHLLGATLAYLLFGPWLAMLALGAAGAAVTLANGLGWATYSVHVLLSAVVPIAVSDQVLRIAERRLPPNYFIYVFVAAFLGGTLAMFASGLATASLVALAMPEAPHAGEDLLPMLLMLGFGEGTLTGMLVSLMVVYRPRWVGTFSDARYLGRGEKE